MQLCLLYPPAVEQLRYSTAWLPMNRELTTSLKFVAKHARVRQTAHLNFLNAVPGVFVGARDHAPEQHPCSSERNAGATGAIYLRHLLSNVSSSSVSLAS